jgi:hypothetical protein
MSTFHKVRTHKATKIALKVWAVTAVPKWGFIGFAAAKKAGLLAPLLTLL